MPFMNLTPHEEKYHICIALTKPYISVHSFFVANLLNSVNLLKTSITDIYTTSHACTHSYTYTCHSCNFTCYTDMFVHTHTHTRVHTRVHAQTYRYLIIDSTVQTWPYGMTYQWLPNRKFGSQSTVCSV